MANIGAEVFVFRIFRVSYAFIIGAESLSFGRLLGGHLGFFKPALSLCAWHKFRFIDGIRPVGVSRFAARADLRRFVGLCGGYGVLANVHPSADRGRAGFFAGSRRNSGRHAVLVDVGGRLENAAEDQSGSLP